MCDNIRNFVGLFGFKFINFGTLSVANQTKVEETNEKVKESATDNEEYEAKEVEEIKGAEHETQEA